MRILIITFFILPMVICSKSKTKSCQEFIKGSTDDLVCRGENTIYCFEENKNDFFESEAECVKKGGHLVGIEDEEEAMFLIDEMKKRGYKKAFTGLNDHFENNDRDEEFVYLTGIMGYAPHDILNEVGNNSPNKDCALLNSGSGNIFLVGSCGGSTTPVTICKLNYFDNGIIFIPARVPRGDKQETTTAPVTDVNWADAEEECKNKAGGGGNLITIDTVGKNRFLTNLLQSRKIVLPVWVGMSYNSESEKFQWTSKSYAVYRKWCPTEPKVDTAEDAPSQCVTFTAESPDITKGCSTIEPCGEGEDELANSRMFVCETKPKCEQEKEHSSRDFTSVILQELGRLKGQCRSCNRKGGHRG